MLSARAISKRYAAVQALDGVDFDVAAGEVVALAGENGSGKSTLAKILAGVVTADAGEIFLDREPLNAETPHEALDRGIALVAQEVTAVPNLSVAENVLLTRMGSPLRLFRRHRAAQQARPLLERLAISCDPLAPFAVLKAGDRELVEVAKALAAQPRILILDEATSRLGERDVERLFALVRELREEGVATVLITHRLREICSLADRTVILRDGRRVAELTSEETTEERLSTAMVGRELKTFFHKRRVDEGDVVLRVEDLHVRGAPGPVSLEVRAGEVLGLAGLVGCGRTELLETIAGARRPLGGRVLVESRAIRLGSPRAALEAGVALVPEDRHRQGLVIGSTVRTNIAMGSWRALAPARRPRERELSENAIQRLGIKAQGAETPLRALSGGNQQKVVLGRCLAADPGVLLLDEPTRGIDVGAKEELFVTIADMLERGMAIVLVSSDMLEILGLADRVLVLHERRVAGELTRAEATEERIAFLAAGGGEQHAA